MESVIHYRILVTGMVQGVGFRWSAAREAWSRGITGYVRNMHDGSVLIEAEGTREQLDGFASWCRRGPGRGFVDNAEVSEGPQTGYNDFTIRH